MVLAVGRKGSFVKTPQMRLFDHLDAHWWGEMQWNVGKRLMKCAIGYVKKLYDIDVEKIGKY